MCTYDGQTGGFDDLGEFEGDVRTHVVVFRVLWVRRVQVEAGAYDSITRRHSASQLVSSIENERQKKWTHQFQSPNHRPLPRYPLRGVKYQGRGERYLLSLPVRGKHPSAACFIQERDKDESGA